MQQVILDKIKTNSLTGIRAGNTRDSFLDIWMVVVDNRIFARSWGLSERSWYSQFLTDPSGAIRCGEHIVPILARVPDDVLQLTDRINQAYLEKYNKGDNAVYAQGIIRPEHIAKTMEFVPVF